MYKSCGILLGLFLIFSVNTANANDGLARIVKGEPAVPQQIPWMAAIYYTTSSLTAFCGGALVSERWVLTAGHCVYNANSFTIFLGTTSVATNDPHRVIVYSNTYVVHPDFNPNSYDSDVGLIYFENVAVTFDDYIRPIAVRATFAEPGMATLISGWGTARRNDTVLTPNLRYAEVTIITNTDCVLYYGSPITFKMVCAVGLGQNLCRGDTGGALVAYDSDSVPSIVGIATLVACEDPYPCGFTRTQMFKTWIDEVIA